MSDDSLLVPAVVLLSCGFAAVALSPRNAASRLLLVAGLAGVSSYFVTPLAADHNHPSATASLLRYAAVATFLLFSATMSVLMLVYPHGAFARSWQRSLAIGVVGLAVTGPVLSLVGAVSLSGEDDPAVHNVLALPGLIGLGRLGALVESVEPMWFVGCFALLLVRFARADRAGRRELLPMVAGLLALVVLLLWVLVDSAGGPARPEPVFGYVFDAALAVVPIALLVGLSRRPRLLASELAASRTRLVAAEDEARRRIERDLHDGVQQQLVALLSLTELASRQARSGSPGLAGTLDDVRGQLTTAVEDLRELVYGIRPPVLEDSGVAAALESRMRRLPPDVRLDLTLAQGRRWAARTEAAAYFVACEAVTNALKHAPGASVRVRLRDEAGDLHLEVEDGGPGISGDVGRGTGLAGLRDRVDSLGGVFTVGSAPTGGTLVRAVFPGGAT